MVLMLPIDLNRLQAPSQTFCKEEPCVHFRAAKNFCELLRIEYLYCHKYHKLKGVMVGSESLLIEEVIKFSHVAFVELKSKCLLLKSKLHRGKIRLGVFLQ